MNSYVIISFILGIVFGFTLYKIIDKIGTIYGIIKVYKDKKTVNVLLDSSDIVDYKNKKAILKIYHMD